MKSQFPLIGANGHLTLTSDLDLFVALASLFNFRTKIYSVTQITASTMSETPSIVEQPQELWRHSAPQTTQMWEFKELVKKKYNRTFNDYHELHQWSIDHITDFWGETWDFTNIVQESDQNPPYQQVSISVWWNLLHFFRIFVCISLCCDGLGYSIGQMEDTG